MKKHLNTAILAMIAASPILVFIYWAEGEYRWLYTAPTAFVSMWVVGAALFSAFICSVAESRDASLDGDTGGGRLRSHEMGEGCIPRRPLWFLRWQGDTWLTMFLSTLIFTFPFFLWMLAWWIYSWNFPIARFAELGFFAALLKAVALWVPGDGDKIYKMTQATGHPEVCMKPPIAYPHSWRGTFLILLAALKGHKQARRELLLVFCQGGIKGIKTPKEMGDNGDK